MARELSPRAPYVSCCGVFCSPARCPLLASDLLAIFSLRSPSTFSSPWQPSWPELSLTVRCLRAEGGGGGTAGSVSLGGEAAFDGISHQTGCGKVRDQRSVISCFTAISKNAQWGENYELGCKSWRRWLLHCSSVLRYGVSNYDGNNTTWYTEWIACSTWKRSGSFQTQGNMLLITLRCEGFLNPWIVIQSLRIAVRRNTSNVSRQARSKEIQQNRLVWRSKMVILRENNGRNNMCHLCETEFM